MAFNILSDFLEMSARTTPGVITSFPDKCVILKITHKICKRRGSIYKTATHRWKANIKRAREADYVLAVIKGVVAGVYKPEYWYYETLENAKKHSDFEYEHGGEYSDVPHKIAFAGKEADSKMQARYFYKRIPDYYMRAGPGPVLYTY